MCACRFDSELSAAQDEVQRERSLREKLAREKDMLTGDAFSLRQQLEVCACVPVCVTKTFFVVCLFVFQLCKHMPYRFAVLMNFLSVASIQSLFSCPVVTEVDPLRFIQAAESIVEVKESGLSLSIFKHYITAEGVKWLTDEMTFHSLEKTIQSQGTLPGLTGPEEFITCVLSKDKSSRGAALLLTPCSPLFVCLRF